MSEKKLAARTRRAALVQNGAHPQASGWRFARQALAVCGLHSNGLCVAQPRDTRLNSSPAASAPPRASPLRTASA
eukprot:6204933-Pleurochrysis_carterae.AAC.3